MRRRGGAAARAAVAQHADVMASLKAGKYTDENTSVLEKVAKELASKY